MAKKHLMAMLATAIAIAGVQAQDEKPSLLKRIKDKAKGTTEQRAENTGDRVGNKIGDKADAAVDSLLSGALFKKKKKKDASQDKKNNTADSIQTNKAEAAPKNAIATNDSFKMYSKFDFVSGSKVLYYENFERADVGDFPTEWNTDGSGEVVTIEGREGKWLNLSKNGTFIPELIKQLPENFTMEFEVGINRDPSNNMYGLGLIFTTDAKKLMAPEGHGSFMYLHPAHGGASFEVMQLGTQLMHNESKMPQWGLEQNSFAKVSIWRQKGRLRLYVNEAKLFDLPRFFAETNGYYFAFSRSFFDECSLFVSNIKYAVGLPDTRNKLITDGRFSTNGILFEVNKADIKPESYGILKEVATTLNDNPTIRVKIVGHSSSDGDAANNLSLSKKRAASVKDMLIKEFGIAENRLETDGKGSTEPVDNSNTTTAKANNRRVEFIKL